MSTTNNTQMAHPFANLLREAFERVQKRKTVKNKGGPKLDLNVLAGSSARKRKSDEPAPTIDLADHEQNVNSKTSNYQDFKYYCLGCPEKFSKRSLFLSHKKSCSGRDQTKIQEFLSANNAKRSKGDIILCVCTNTEKQALADDDGPMVQCDWCEAWLHLQCLPSNLVSSHLYYCDRCIDQYSGPEVDQHNLYGKDTIDSTYSQPQKKSKTVTFNIHPELDSDPPLDNLNEYTNFEPIRTDQVLSAPASSNYPQATSNFTVDPLTNLVTNADSLYNMFPSNAYNSEINSEFLSETFMPSSIADNNDFLSSALFLGDGANLLTPFDILNATTNISTNSVLQPIFDTPNNIANSIVDSRSIIKQNQQEFAKSSDLKLSQTEEEALQLPSDFLNRDNSLDEHSIRQSPYFHLPPIENLEISSQKR